MAKPAKSEKRTTGDRDQIVYRSHRMPWVQEILVYNSLFYPKDLDDAFIEVSASQDFDHLLNTQILVLLLGIVQIFRPLAMTISDFCGFTSRPIDLNAHIRGHITVERSEIVVSIFMSLINPGEKCRQAIEK
ncbi:hypothetical protein RF11_10317 [Thelohanellus kitauei]|uniref:Uncharacterized protein n=1 Tax=Thelohanellus kitauei TaxID=669202 RepID=A0A0C2MVY1_THEKT|nr:hypothetical protein RF11_10317 [Thelohanellus kitauei]